MYSLIITLVLSLLSPNSAEFGNSNSQTEIGTDQGGLDNGRSIGTDQGGLDGQREIGTDQGGLDNR